MIITCIIFSFQGKHSTNLKNHLARAHAAEYRIVSELNKDNPKTAKQKKEKSNDVDVRTILKLCMRLVTVHGRPLDLIEDDAFQRIITLAANCDECDQINIGAVKRMVHEQASIVRHKISSEIKNKLVCLKLDFATYMKRKFTGINIQYIRGGEIVSRNLAVLEVTQDKIESFLEENLEAVLADFDITADNIYCICTDSEANMNKMNLRQTNYTTNDENTAVTMQDSDGSNFMDDESKENNVVVKLEVNDPLSINFEEIDAGKPNEDTEMKDFLETTVREKSSHNDSFCSDDLDVNVFLPHKGFIIRGIVCLTHTFQLAINDALNEDLNARSTIIMARKIVDTIREPNNMSKLKAAKLKNPITDCPTEWTSTYNMLLRLITFKDFCDAIIDLSSYFWEEVSGILECLGPANAAITDLQRQNLTIGDFYIIWLNCKGQIANINHRFAKTLHNALQVRETILLKNDVVLEALYIDRRLNLMLNDEQCELAKVCLKKTYERLIKVKDLTNNVEVDQNSKILSMPSTSGSLPALEEMLAKAEKSRGLYKTRSAFDASLIELVCSPRIPLTENIVMYWNNTKTPGEMAMSVVANTVLAVPATRISIEKLYLSLNFIMDPIRTSLNEKLVKDMLLVRENCDLID